ncbi:hypothetical protein D9613_002946 [Agrocybe pediades]|uniref:Uncharacterized protein n=1 Tax=Agrocybe pediades TaxID=84607 RepID=A0A8H4VPA5_9AGAR|nr:hypothetical protein D9613_002946 [Agrocybe pediades]
MQSFAAILYLFLSCSVSIAGREEKRQPKGHDGLHESGEHESGKPVQTTPPAMNPPSPSANMTTTTALAITTQTATATTTETQTQTLSPQPSSTGISFKFNTLPNTTVCGSQLLSWIFTSMQVVDITLTISASTGNTTTSQAAQPSLGGSTLTTTIFSTADAYRWSPVNVSVGWYVATAFDTAGTLNISDVSSPFHVDQSEDTSCLSSTVVNASATAHPMSPSATSQSHNRNVIPAGDIAGIAIGATAGILLMIYALAYSPWRVRQKNPETKQRTPRLLY